MRCTVGLVVEGGLVIRVLSPKGPRSFLSLAGQKGLPGVCLQDNGLHPTAMHPRGVLAPVPSPRTLTNMKTYLTALPGVLQALCCKINV